MLFSMACLQELWLRAILVRSDVLPTPSSSRKSVSIHHPFLGKAKNLL